MMNGNPKPSQGRGGVYVNRLVILGRRLSACQDQLSEKDATIATLTQEKERLEDDNGTLSATVKDHGRHINQLLTVNSKLKATVEVEVKSREVTILELTKKLKDAERGKREAEDELQKMKAELDTMNDVYALDGEEESQQDNHYSTDDEEIYEVALAIQSDLEHGDLGGSLNERAQPSDPASIEMEMTEDVMDHGGDIMILDKEVVSHQQDLDLSKIKLEQGVEYMKAADCCGNGPISMTNFKMEDCKVKPPFTLKECWITLKRLPVTSPGVLNSNSEMALTVFSGSAPAPRRNKAKCRKFSCPKCRKEFTYWGYLYRHLKKVHNATVVGGETGCSLCGLHFPNKSAYTKHRHQFHSRPSASPRSSSSLSNPSS